jgi:hypothetical protein
MVALLNYAHWILAVIFIFAYFKILTSTDDEFVETIKKPEIQKKIVAVGILQIVLTIVLKTSQPHLPKPGTPAPLKNPPFEQTEAVIEDRLLKPSEAIDERFEEKFDAVRQATEK